MSLQPIKLVPGINRQNTNYASKGGYYACDKVRFRDGMPEKIGGWVKYNQQSVLGTARNLFCWVSLNRSQLLAVGTNQKYYIELNGGYYDITPIRRTVTLADASLSATNGSNIIKVSDSPHGMATGDSVTFSGAVGFAGLTAGQLNLEFQATVIDTSNYSIIVSSNATSTATGGGAAVSAAYQMNSGLGIAVPGRGYGAGPYGRKTYGSPADELVYSPLRLWSQESFGENHVFCTLNDAIYYWSFAAGTSTRAVALAGMAGASDVPLMAKKLLMSTSDRHMVAYGCNSIGNARQDPLLVRWSDTENILDWTPSVTNAAGDFRLGSGNTIVTAIHTKQETLIFTDGQIYSQQYVGAPFIFGFTPVAENISIVSPNAVVTANNAVFWMGDDKFYAYSGSTATLPCTLQDYVFKDFNKTQKAQVFAGTNEGFSEIWWFYCSKNSVSVDRYIVYNYDARVWYYGSMSRTAWLDSPLKPSPVAADANILYYQENGVDADNGVPMHAFIESADFDISNGDQLMFISRMLPDVSFTGSVSASPSVDLSIAARQFPVSGYVDTQIADVEFPTVVQINQSYGQADVRLRGRQVRMRVESNDLGVQWKLGVPRVDVQPDGNK